MMPLRLTALVALATVIGCAAHDSMNEGAREMSAALTDASAENERHASACVDATSTSGLMGETDQHETTMADVMARMDHARQRMMNTGAGSMMGGGYCSGPSFDHMSGSLDDVHTEMSRHFDRMRGAETLEAAQTECATHTDAMRTMMQSMMGDVDSMSCMGM